MTRTAVRRLVLLDGLQVLLDLVSQHPVGDQVLTLAVGQAQRTAPVDVDVVLGALLTGGPSAAGHHDGQAHHVLADGAQELRGALEHGGKVVLYYL